MNKVVRENCIMSNLSSPNTISMIMSRRTRWVKDVAYMGQKRNAHRILVGKVEGKRLIRRQRYRWDNIKMDLTEIELGGMDWINMAEERGQW
jgi:hypothetical protein